MFDVASFWISLAGAALAARGRRRAGGLLLLTVACGYAGIIHERLSGSRLSGYRHPAPGQFNRNQLGAHALIGAIGWRLLKP